MNWQTPHWRLRHRVSNLSTGDFCTFGDWIIVRHSAAVYRVKYRGAAEDIERVSANHWTRDLVDRVVAFVLSTTVTIVDDVIQLSMFPGFVPDIVAQVAKVITKTREQVGRVIREFARKLHKNTKATLTVNELPLFAWRPPTGQQAA